MLKIPHDYRPELDIAIIVVERIEILALQLASVSPDVAKIDVGPQVREGLTTMCNLVAASADGHAPSTAYLDARMPEYLRSLVTVYRQLEDGRPLLAGAPLRLVP